MFLLNKSLKCIEAAEPSVVAVHRSSAAISLAPENQKQQMCDAFLCVVREHGHERVYVAVSPNLSKETLVYAPDPSLQPLSTADTVHHGLFFLENMGFQMERCNLEGSAALREVVLRGIKVLQPPGSRAAKSSLESGPKAALPEAGGVTARQGTEKPQAETAAACAEPGRPAEARVEISVAELAELRAELKRLGAEKDDVATASSTRIGELERELAAAQAELAHFSAEREAAAAATAPPEEVAAHNDLALLQDEYEALRAEYALINEELTERQTHLQQLRSEMEAAQEAATEEIAALKSTILRLSVDSMRAEKIDSEASDWAGPALDADQPKSPSPTRHGERSVSASPEPASPATLATSEAPLQDKTAGSDEPVSFHHDPSLFAISCRSTSDVIDLRVSFNTIRMICGGSNAQNCSAYICGLERNGSKEVYVALYLQEDRKSMIYVPARQPADAAEYDRVLEGAVSFTDVVGFIINLEYLGGGAAARAKVFQQIPVFG